MPVGESGHRSDDLIVVSSCDVFRGCLLGCHNREVPSHRVRLAVEVLDGGPDRLLILEACGHPVCDHFLSGPQRLLERGDCGLRFRRGFVRFCIQYVDAGLEVLLARGQPGDPRRHGVVVGREPLLQSRGRAGQIFVHPDHSAVEDLDACLESLLRLRQTCESVIDLFVVGGD